MVYRHRSDQIRERRAAPQLHRESAILERETGIKQSNCPDRLWMGGVMRVGELLGPIAAGAAAMGQELLKGDYIPADGQTIPVDMQMHDGRGKNHRTTKPTLAIQSPGGT